uniref:Uncharacterized protein n=1 Tax=Desertifilum tharense IPPAS B-1220 TaxID=1781255 RepID=A0ACD5H2X7_9CYAN
MAAMTSTKIKANIERCFPIMALAQSHKIKAIAGVARSKPYPG